MERYSGLVVVGIALIALVAMSLLLVSAASSEEELQGVFKKYCGACHRGRLAPDWTGTIEKIREWASKYNSLDEAVRAEYSFRGKKANSYDEMMQQMKQFSPGISDEDFQKLYDFFKNVFVEAKGGTIATTTATGTTTQSPTTTTETTTTQPPGAVETVTVTETVTVEHTVTVTYGSPETGKVLEYSLLALVVIVIVIAGLVFYGMRRGS